MEWIKDYWYLILPGLLAVLFFFGHKTKGSTDKNIPDGDQHGEHTAEKAHKSGHGCCH